MKTLSLFLLIFISVSGYSQTAERHPEDGVYLSFDELRENRPSIKRQQLFRSMYDSGFTILQWSRSPSLYYLDSENQKVSMKRESIVMIAENGTAYIRQNGVFHRASLFGPVIVFTENYPKVNDPMAVVVTDIKASSRDRILDTENETVMDYTLANFLNILKRDEALYNQFNAIKSTKQKRKMVYSYIEKYNSRNAFSKP
jgi:hypothetical protein